MDRPHVIGGGKEGREGANRTMNRNIIAKQILAWTEYANGYTWTCQIGGDGSEVE